MSDDDREYVGLCAEFPSLSWLAATPERALRGIRKVVAGINQSVEMDYAPSNPGKQLLRKTSELLSGFGNQGQLDLEQDVALEDE